MHHHQQIPEDTLATRETTLKSWLRDKVAPAYDAHRADPGLARPLDDAMARVRDRIAKGERAG